MRSKLLFAGLSAALLLSMAVASASANKLSNSSRTFRIVWSSLELGSEIGTVRCPVTLEGSFHSATISKVTNALIGYITRGTVVTASCTGGRATINQEALPWHIRYDSFRGTLPAITGITQTLIGSKFTVELGGLTCTTVTTATNPAKGISNIAASGLVTGNRADELATIPLRGNFFCEIGGNGSFSGTGTVTQLGNTTAVFVRLI